MPQIKEPLTPEKCQEIVVQSTPDRGRFDPTSDPTTVTLFDLGVVGSNETAVFVKAVKNRLKPWQIKDADIASAPSNTVQQSADSLGEHAF
jgi:hypothetical protein